MEYPPPPPPAAIELPPLPTAREVLDGFKRFIFGLVKMYISFVVALVFAPLIIVDDLKFILGCVLAILLISVLAPLFGWFISGLPFLWWLASVLLYLLGGFVFLLCTHDPAAHEARAREAEALNAYLEAVWVLDN